MKAEIITIGDEILLGQIIDSNSAWIAQALLSQQVQIAQITSVSDQQSHILEALASATQRADLIICTGGLGPTNDDITKKTAAVFFNTTLVRDQSVLDHVQAIFARFNRKMPAVNFQQADILKNADVLFNDWGTAPGMWVENEGKIFVFLPGVPFEMKNLMSHRVMPKLQQYESKEKIAIRYLLTVGVGESHLAEQIIDIENSFPNHVHLAYLPKIGLVRLRLSASGTDIDQLERDVEWYAGLLIKRLGPSVIALQDVGFEEVIVQSFNEVGVSLSTAESCTGGNISRLLTEIPGASNMFMGGIVAYSNQLKCQMLKVQENAINTFGAVSEEVAKQMAIGAKNAMGTTYAIAVTGIAGPGGGSEEKSVGTVWIAIAGKNEVFTKLFHFHQDRVLNIERASAQALLMLWTLFQKELRL